MCKSHTVPLVRAGELNSDYKGCLLHYYASLVAYGEITLEKITCIGRHVLQGFLCLHTIII